MASSRIRDFEDFVKVHALLLAASGIPSSLHRQLFQKLSSETFDSGDFFQVELYENGPQRRLVLTSDFMEKESQLFLIDHAWTFRLSDARKQLQDIPGLAQRMASLMCVDIDLTSDTEEADLEPEGSHENSTKNVMEILEREIRQAQEKGIDSVMWLELEELDIDDAMLLSLDLSIKFPNLLALSLCGNRIQDASTVVQEITKFKNLRALWLNENPVLKNGDDQMADAILQGVPSLEIYNSCFTSNFGEWALGFCGGLCGKDKPGCFHNTTNPLETMTSLDLSNRCIHNLFNKAFSATEMPSLSYLNLRGNPLEQNSAEDLLKLLKGFSCLQELEVDIPGPLGGSALQILESLPNLSLLNDVNVSTILETGKHLIDSMLQPRLPEWKSDEPLADRVISAMWLFLMTYRLADEEKIDETSVWYVMDELGSALRHSDEPNFRVSPFLFMPDGKFASAMSFSILWPTQNIHKGDECTRDFLFGVGEDKQRSARLTAWFHTPKNYFIKEYEKYHVQLCPRTSASPCIEASKARSLLQSDGRALRVYTDLPQVEEFLTRPEFSLTPDPKDADIIWTSMQMDDDFKKASGVTDDQYINQFPFEACLVMKHHLAETVQKAYGSPEWFQPTYNLETHLSTLIGDYYVRERDGLDNLWILKPWNMARTIDTTVTGDLSAIIRLMETGPKICQKYIEHPALFRGKKFDLRYIVLVRSMNPLEIFLSDVFWARLANNNYSLDKHSFFEYETHFTVMNYIGKLNHMNTPDFVMEFEKEHQVKWMDIHHRIQKMIRAVFEAAATVHPEMHGSTSRAIYGVDVMLDCSFQPKLLEVTYCPDCTRACKYDTKAVVGNGDIVKAEWWVQYGMDSPNLRRIAMKVLSQTYSATGCERNWSTFSLIHSKKRNRLSTKRLEELVYCHYNMRLRMAHIQQGIENDNSPIELSDVFQLEEEEEDPLYGWVDDRGSPVLDQPGGRPDSDIAREMEADVDAFMADLGAVHVQNPRPFQSQPGDDGDSFSSSPGRTSTPDPTQHQGGDDDDDDDDDDDFGGGSGDGGRYAGLLRDHDDDGVREASPVRFTGETQFTYATQDRDHGARPYPRDSRGYTRGPRARFGSPADDVDVFGLFDTLGSMSIEETVTRPGHIRAILFVCVP